MRERHRYLFAWLQQSTAKDATYGQEVESWTEQGELWGEVEAVGAMEGVKYGLLGSQVDVKITFREDPGIRFVDRLRDKDRNIVYRIEGVTWGFRKTIITASQFRDQ